MRIGGVIALLGASALVSGAARAADGLDPGFGTGGYVGIGFQAVVDDAQDIGVVACAAPGSLLAVGFASGGRRVVSTWLTAQGALDSDFGDGDGKESFDLPSGTLGAHSGLCGSDGSVTCW